MNRHRFPYIAAPALMAAYGLVRLADTQRIGFAWNLGHLLMLAGLVLFVWVVDGLRRAVPGRVGAVLAGVTYLGLAATVVQFVIDIVVGVLADDRAEKSHLSQQVQAVPGVMPVVYTVVPLLFHLGVIALAVRAAVVRPRPLPWWSPVLLLTASVAAAVSLDYIPVAGALYVVALLPLARRTTGNDQQPVPATV